MELINFILQVDVHLANVIAIFGLWTYVILFAVIFAETGFVVTPFLPGDSLLFAVGTFASIGLLSIWKAYLLLLAAAILGDSVNYWIGHKIGYRLFSKKDSRIFKVSYLEKTQEFYRKHGVKTIILARFVPIVRTFAPFVAGIGKMEYRTFLTYNVVGAFLWVTLFTLAGYFFGKIPFIKENFEYVVIGIVIISLLPMLFEYLRSKLRK